MSSEIIQTVALGVEKGLIKIGRNVSQQADMSGLTYNCDVQLIPTTHTAISVGSVSTVGWVLIHNLDSINYVEIGLVVSAVFQPMIKLKPGEATLFRAATNSLYAKANTASISAEIWIIED